MKNSVTSQAVFDSVYGVWSLELHKLLLDHHFYVLKSRYVSKYVTFPVMSLFTVSLHSALISQHTRCLTSSQSFTACVAQMIVLLVVTPNTVISFSRRFVGTFPCVFKKTSLSSSECLRTLFRNVECNNSQDYYMKSVPSSSAGGFDFRLRGR